MAPHIAHPLTLLLIQIIVVLTAARLAARAIRRFGQPAVIGEILAGILLGPSLLGAVAPKAMNALFPPSSLPALGLLAQVGVLLFMFAVGLEVDLAGQRSRARAAIATSLAGIVLPFVLGMGLAAAAFEQLAPTGVAFLPFALFFGISLSVTAFPVLARILQERGLSQSPPGQTAIASAAISDLLAWCVLAVVVAIVNAHGLGDAAWTVALAAGFAGFMVFFLREPLQRRVDAQFAPDGENHSMIASLLIFAFACALITDAIGIHALFGAFLAGAVVSARPEARQFVHDRVLPLSSLILLPLFFAQVGLRTRVGLLDSMQDWLLCALIVAIAVAGKLGGVTLAARATGMAWREAFTLGALMNTRGLMELIVLNIGYDLGILSPRVFTMLVIMALLTTLLTGPLVKRALRS